MSKSKELNELKKRYENLTEEIRELSEEELAQVTGGQDLKWITLFTTAAPNLGYVGPAVDK